MGDCRTFFRVRHDQRDWYKTEQGDRPFGGGNFLMALGLLSVLNFLAKVQLQLTEPEAFVTEADRITVKNARKEIIIKMPEVESILTGRRTKWIAQPVGSCNETEAFAALVKAVQPVANLGLNEANVRDVWAAFRNHLAHMAWPKEWIWGV